MSPLILRRFPPTALTAWLLLVLSTVGGSGQPTGSPSMLIPEIRMDQVPLSEAIKNLARQADLNFILDPELGEPAFGPDGRLVPEPTVTGRWENLTAEQALAMLLKEHGLRMAANPVTTVTRIISTNRVARPVDGNLVGGSTHTIPLIVMDSVPLADAITRMAGEAHLEVIIDPSLSDRLPGRAGRTTTRPVVSMRWKNLTAKQALLALCENYDLAVVKDPATGTPRIRFRDPPTAQ